MIQIAGCEEKTCAWCLETYTRQGPGVGRRLPYCNRRCAYAARKGFWHHGVRGIAGHEWDAVLPEQIGTSSGREPGEYALLHALLERAVMDLTPDGKGKRSRERGDEDYKSARAWFDSEDDGPWTFHWVAQHLGIDPGWFRSNLARTKIKVRFRRAHSRSSGETTRAGGRYPATTQNVVVSACNG